MLSYGILYLQSHAHGPFPYRYFLHKKAFLIPVFFAVVREEPENVN